MPILNNPVYRSFVAPDLCIDLHNAGLLINTPFNWIVEEGGEEVLLATDFFDDLTQKMSKANIAYLVKYKGIHCMGTRYPAFTFADMTMILPDFLLSRNNIEYEIHCSSLFPMEVEKAERFPDAAAAIVIKAIIKNLIPLNQAINLILKQ